MRSRAMRGETVHTRPVESSGCGRQSRQPPPDGAPDPLPHFDAFVHYCSLLPRGVRSMTLGEFCADVAEGIRRG